MNNLLHDYFQSQLVASGFPNDLDIYWSLSYCQGDGMAFYGTLYPENLCQLFNHLHPNQKRQQNKFALLVERIMEWETYQTFSIYRNGFGYRYSHFNTMELDIPSAEELSFFCEEVARQTWYFPRSKVQAYQALWNTFISDLEAHIREISRQLADEGYRILEATPDETQVAYQFNTSHYCVELIQEPAELPHMFLDEESEEVILLCQSFIEGKSYCADLYARVIERQSGLLLGQSERINLVYDLNDRYFSGYKNELVSEAICQSRQNIQRLSQQFACLKG